MSEPGPVGTSADLRLVYSNDSAKPSGQWTESPQADESRFGGVAVSKWLGAADGYATKGSISFGAKQSGDRTAMKDHTKVMSEITREEFSAKIETIEVKMDARVELVSAKIDAFVATQAERDKRLESVIAQIGVSQAETKAGLSSMKNTMIITAISTVIAVVFGIASFNTALTANMMSAFQLGKAESVSAPPSQPPASAASPATGQGDTKK